MSPRRPHKIEPKTLGQARDLRSKQTPAEKILWRRLRDEQVMGFKFRRQFPIGSSIADFCCPQSKLVIEIDGDTHAGRAGHDAARSKHIEDAGYRVMRFTNSDVHERVHLVVEAILKECEHLGQ